MEENVGDGQGR